MYGLLTYGRFHPDDHIVKACERMADLLIGTFGEGTADITDNGTRCGISSTTVLESINMLYERTHEERFLKFAEHIVDCSEYAPGLRLMAAMLKKKDVSGPGDGKAYQLMANLLGYLLLYEHTGDERYLKTVQNGWENIKTHHVYVTGGPWSRHMYYNGNKECFALPQDFESVKSVVETCSTTTWIQLNLHLLELTGQAQIKVTGNYPVSPSIGICFEQADGKEFAVEFRNPCSARLASVRINGKDIVVIKNGRGFYQLSRAWKTGDEIAIEFEYLLKSHIETPKGGQRWVAFTYGPWALAQKIDEGVAVDEPFFGKDVPSRVASEWLVPYPTQEGAVLRFRIKSTKILLGPFYCTGSKKTGPPDVLQVLTVSYVCLRRTEHVHL